MKLLSAGRWWPQSVREAKSSAHIISACETETGRQQNDAHPIAVRSPCKQTCLQQSEVRGIHFGCCLALQSTAVCVSIQHQPNRPSCEAQTRLRPYLFHVTDQQAEVHLIQRITSA